VPPTAFAESLSAQLRSFFPISNGEELASVIDFNANFIGRDQHDDLASLLFVEFGQCAEESITLDAAKAIVARVQKRLYRSTRKKEQTLDRDVQAESYVAQTEVESIIREVARTLPADDMLLFQLRYVEDKPVASICEELGLAKSTVYTRLEVLRQRFERFVKEGR
jgi:RNA polymerase sigma factor (sigma-70 family)